MIRKTLRYFLLGYLGLSGLIVLVFRKTGDTLAIGFSLLAGIVICITLGLFLGLVASVLFKKPAQEKKFYLAGQILSFLLLSSFFLYMVGHSLIKERATYVQNEAPAAPSVENYSAVQIQVACDSIRLRLKNPNDLILHNYIAIEDEKEIAAGTDSSLIVYFMYSLPKDTTEDLFAKYQVSHSKARLVYYNMDTTSSWVPEQIRQELKNVGKQLKQDKAAP